MSVHDGSWWWLLVTVLSLRDAETLLLATADWLLLLGMTLNTSLPLTLVPMLTSSSHTSALSAAEQLHWWTHDSDSGWEAPVHPRLYQEKIWEKSLQQSVNINLFEIYTVPLKLLYREKSYRSFDTRGLWANLWCFQNISLKSLVGSFLRKIISPSLSIWEGFRRYILNPHCLTSFLIPHMTYQVSEKELGRNKNSIISAT